MPAERNGAFVFMGDDPAVRQPATFRCCPLGVQFCLDHDVEKYCVLEIKLDVPGRNSVPDPITCSGVVVHTSRDAENVYRVWVFFLDLPDSVRNHLHCIAKESGTLCPHCANF